MTRQCSPLGACPGFQLRVLADGSERRRYALADHPARRRGGPSSSRGTAMPRARDDRHAGHFLPDTRTSWFGGTTRSVEVILRSRSTATQTLSLYGPLSPLRATTAPVLIYVRGYDGTIRVTEAISFSNPNLPDLSPVRLSRRKPIIITARGSIRDRLGGQARSTGSTRTRDRNEVSRDSPDPRCLRSCPGLLTTSVSPTTASSIRSVASSAPGKTGGWETGPCSRWERAAVRCGRRRQGTATLTATSVTTEADLQRPRSITLVLTERSCNELN